MSRWKCVTDGCVPLEMSWPSCACPGWVPRTEQRPCPLSTWSLSTACACSLHLPRREPTTLHQPARGGAPLRLELWSSPCGRAACFGAHGWSALFMVHHPEQSSLLGLARAAPSPIALQLHSATFTFQTPRLGQAPHYASHPERRTGLLFPRSLGSDQIGCLLCLNSKLPRASRHLPCLLVPSLRPGS